MNGKENRKGQSMDKWEGGMSYDFVQRNETEWLFFRHGTGLILQHGIHSGISCTAKMTKFCHSVATS